MRMRARNSLLSHSNHDRCNDILDFSKIEAGRRAIEQIDFELDEVLENLSSLIGLKASDNQPLR